ncbi:sodium/hydrogen exchanger 9B2-like isoform X2 [Gigantopelta aegis]|uniref:sodium/hydrogen exchanger 9B2-like isoform X2 n=1 Tax=Gigantopelta aegis TaxID=1735272 RepID=UPI001B887FE0|nr:sodium/hydrogen exchanger 9B2-like isoform X2 [Gigantopelta aegis]
MDNTEHSDLHLQEIRECDESVTKNGKDEGTLCKSNSFSNREVTFQAEDEVPKRKKPERCVWCRLCCGRCTSPLLTTRNPLPSNPSCCDRFKFALLCPPHGRVGGFLFLLILFFTLWGFLVAVTDKNALPGGNLFSLLVLFFTCWFGGYLISFIRLPPLLGMLIVGGLLNNVPHISIAKDIDHTWSAGARQIALTVILIRAGLGLDPKALRRLSFVVVRLAFSPCLVETVTDGIAAHLLLGFPWEWGFMLGFVIAAVSPAVVVPSLLGLQERGYGVEKGVPTLVIAAASIDDVLAITGFGVLMGITFSKGNLVWTLFKGPLEAIVGVIYGILMGIVLWYVPHKSSKHLVLFRSTLLLGLGLLAIFLSIYLEWSGAGPLGCLSLAFVAALKWRKEVHPDDKNPIENVVGVLWMIFQPLLFGLIGAAVNISDIDTNTIALGLATLGIGLGIRMLVSFCALFCSSLNMRERIFIAIAWLPKATVQAAIGALALDQAMSRNKSGMKNDDEIKYGKQVLTIAVLSILITAPIGSTAIAFLGPRLLKHRLQSTQMTVEVDANDKQQLHDTNGEESLPLNNQEEHPLT